MPTKNAFLYTFTGSLSPRVQAEAKLREFVDHKLSLYAKERNSDYGSLDRNFVSGLSAYIRHRVLTEEDVLRAVLKNGTYPQFEKFIQEVFWRTYWKGWLELRPSVWTQYQVQVKSLQVTYEKAVEKIQAGQSGIRFFDQWTEQLLQTGYLHNHTRMWWASIWIHTLKLPWQLGADFFLRHLQDGDPASNTLSWRWVAGLQTKGKAYLATKENIEKYSAILVDDSVSLASQAVSIADLILEKKEDLPVIPEMSASQFENKMLLLHEEDLLCDQNLGSARVVILDPALYQKCSQSVLAFKQKILKDSYPGAEWISSPAELDLLLRSKGHDLVTVAPHVGPLRDFLAERGQKIPMTRRSWDQNLFPYAQKGFFSFKENIPLWIRTYL
jgi:hypothetical protein